MTASWPNGEVERLQVVKVDHVPDPSPAQWAVLDRHRDDVAAFTPRIFSPAEMRALVAAGTLGVYQIEADGTPLGSMVLELIDWQGGQALTVIWLRLKPGTMSRQVKRAILQAWKRIMAGAGTEHLVIQGRPGWESILIQEGLKPRELSRVWHSRLR